MTIGLLVYLRWYRLLCLSRRQKLRLKYVCANYGQAPTLLTFLHFPPPSQTTVFRRQNKEAFPQLKRSNVNFKEKRERVHAQPGTARAHTVHIHTQIHARAVVQCYHTHQTPATNMQVLQRLSGMQLDIKLLLMYGPSWLKHPQNNKHCTCCRSFKTQCSTFLSTATQISRDFLCCGTADCAVGWS